MKYYLADKDGLIDIAFEKVANHVDAEIKLCPRCRTQNKGVFPQEMSGPLQQYGPGIKGYAMNLLIAQMLSLKRIEQSIKTLIGLALSEATLLKNVMQMHLALEAWEQATTEQLLQMPSLHVDETSLRVERKNYWIHLYSTGDFTIKRLHMFHSPTIAPSPVCLRMRKVRQKVCRGLLPDLQLPADHVEPGL